MKKIGQRALVILRNPQLRPVEKWALRAAYLYVAYKLGLDVKNVAS